MPAKSVFTMIKPGINIRNTTQHTTTAHVGRYNCHTTVLLGQRERNTALISANLFSILSHVGNVVCDW